MISMIIMMVFFGKTDDHNKHGHDGNEWFPPRLLERFMDEDVGMVVCQKMMKNVAALGFTQDLL